MQQLAAWQLAVVAIAGAAGLGMMVSACIRLMSRRSPARAVERPGSALESGAYGVSAPEGVRVFDAWSYRVGARFAGRVRVLVSAHRVVVCGPRVPGHIYDLWIWVQALLLGLVPAALAWALVTLDRRALAFSAGLFVASFVVSILGAGLWPALGELPGIQAGRFPALDLPRSAVSAVRVGAGWSDGGLAVVLAPYRPGIDALAAGRAVSFFGPDERGREVRFALHCYSDAEAEGLAGLLGRE